MKNFTVKTRIIYFAIIALVSIAFFVLQLYANSGGDYGIGSIVVLILWGLLAAFGIAGLIFTLSKRDRHKK
ncbi:MULTISPECIES: hypothetical protein [unclassified Planococcus (in: firmicutes)]|uniref:hypothetical protein n=1 Tax=unclassified Planococcus (in: firmicutes) TaxID=2662419 RepID=UPI001F279F43|nr:MULTISPECIES: hypothetical protein [unclassified Planococcus (in: firmicutes)]UJF27279.1 hypothetical protein L0M13_01750 [Planococcus sp. 107-1]GKW46354.1 hypothetical protein NCCP2050_20460 [Planococcus sp. NCCP-2050]